MWYTKVKFHGAPFSGAKEKEVHLEDGLVKEKIVDLSAVVLPSTSNFDLETQIKSGVDLQQQNCKILQPHLSAEELDVLENVFEQNNKETQEKEN